jgi:large subunit ribosomal protein L10
VNFGSLKVASMRRVSELQGTVRFQPVLASKAGISASSFEEAGQTGAEGQSSAPKWREHVERAAKKELVTTLHEVFKTSGVVVVAHNKGLTVNQVNDLRGKMAKAGATVKVAKNRLAKIALDGTDAKGISDLFTGPTMVAYGMDPVSAPKVAADFAKANEKFVVLGGALGKTIMDAKGVKALAELPSLDQLRGKLIGLIQAPATKIAGVLAAPAGQLARVLNAYATKDN